MVYGENFLYLLFGGIFTVDPGFYIYFFLQSFAALFLIPISSLHIKAKPIAARFGELIFGSLVMPIGIMIGSPIMIMVVGPILVLIAFFIEVFGIPIAILYILYRVLKDGYIRLRRFQTARLLKAQAAAEASD